MFDWDDNLLNMPTKIKLKNKKTNEIIEVSTDEFTEYRKNQNFEFIEESFEEFQDFGPRRKNAFIEDCKVAIYNNNFGPSWDDFIKCLTNGYLFAIITMRGHEISTFKNTIKFIIENILTNDQQNDMIANLISFKDFYNKGNFLNQYDEDYLIEKYLNNCKYYPITNPNIYRKFKLNPLKEQEKLKKLCVKDFVDYINNLNKEKDVSKKFGFSDDDPLNIEKIKKEFSGEEDLSIFLTKYKKEKV